MTSGVLDGAARGARELLVAEAHAEDRHADAPQHVERDAGVARVLGPGRDHHVVELDRGELLPRQLVVAHDDRLLVVDLAEQMEEVEGVGVVVVDQQRAHQRGLHTPDCHPCGSRVRMRVAVVGSTGGWHAERLERALTGRGHECRFAPVTRMASRIDGGITVRSRDVQLDSCDVVLVRGIPRGSLEQIVFRVDALHALEAAGVRAVNGALAIERAIDKFLASALVAAAGVPTPRTVACERADDALEAFAELGSDVIVKPLFGSMGFGMARVEDPDIAQRVFRALEIERAVYYLHETVPHDGVDVRALVVGERVVAAMERVGTGWRANLSRGARARPVALDEHRAALCVRAAAALGADYAGVDLLRAADGRDFVLEVNAIPGWHGLEQATGIDVAAALVAHLERV